MASYPKLKENYDEILRRVQKLIALDSWDGEVTKKFTKPSAPGQFVFELPQVRRILPSSILNMLSNWTSGRFGVQCWITTAWLA